MHDFNRQISRRAFLGLAGLSLSSLLPACSTPDEAPQLEDLGRPRTLDEIRASGHWRIGIYTDARPLAGIDGGGNYSGLDHYLCNYFIDKTRLWVNVVPIDPRDRYDALLSGKTDVCISGMSPSDDRAGEVAFANPLYRLRLALASPNDALVESAEQLAGGTLIVCEGSYAEQYAAATWPEVPRRPYATISSAHQALVDGQGTALLEDEVPMVFWLKETPGFSLGMRGIGEERIIAPAVAPGQEDVLEQVTTVTRNFITNGWSRTAFDTLVLPDVGETYSGMLCRVVDHEE